MDLSKMTKISWKTQGEELYKTAGTKAGNENMNLRNLSRAIQGLKTEVNRSFVPGR